MAVCTVWCDVERPRIHVAGHAFYQTSNVSGGAEKDLRGSHELKAEHGTDCAVQLIDPYLCFWALGCRAGLLHFLTREERSVAAL